MTGFGGTDGVELAATWVAAIATIAVLGGMLGERRLFGWSQHLLAGLVTGFLALVAITEVIGPRIVAPLVAGGADRAELWLGAGLVGLTAAAPWLPRAAAAVPISIAVGSLAAFALGGAVVGTLLPQVAATVPGPATSPAATVGALAGSAITALVLLTFVHGVPRGKVLSVASTAGRWLLVAALGGWLGYLILSRLVLLVDRLDFLVVDWLGIGR